MTTETTTSTEDGAPPAESGRLANVRRYLDRAGRPALLIAAGVLVMLPVVGMIWYFSQGEAVDEAALHAEAVELIHSEKSAARERARRIASWLQQQEWKDPAFPGGIDYVLGLAEFHRARADDDGKAHEHYLEAARLLSAAEGQALDASLRPQWSFATGISLYHLGRYSRALPLLQEALTAWDPGFVQVSECLSDIYLDQNTPASLELALQLCNQLQQRPRLTVVERDMAWLQQARVLLALGQTGKARAALRHVSQAAGQLHALTVVEAMVLMAEGQPAEALEQLRPVADDSGLDRTWPRQAAWLMGVCAERLGDTDAAVTYFERAANRYEGSEESLAAALRLGNLQRIAGRNEQALSAYRLALSTVERPEDFQNRWVSREDFQQAIIDAWNGWVNSHHYRDAITLARLAPPLIPESRAAQLRAQASQYRALHLQEELSQAPWTEQHARREELIRRWQQAGDASAGLAEALKTTAEYGDALWDSAEHYRRGHDFEAALAQLDRFIDTRPRTLLPLALVRRGQILLDLGRLDESLENLQSVVEEHPTSNAAFLARYTIGQVLLELDRVDDAEAAWTQLLTSGELTPRAAEWRQALFSLGRLMTLRAGMLRQQLRMLQLDPEPDQTEVHDLHNAIHERWETAIGMLDEYLQRYADEAEVQATAIEARSLLADALRESADRPRQKLNSAETDNARAELRREINQLLRQSNEQYHILQTTLLELDETGRLDQLGQMLLRDSWFRIAQVLYELEDYAEAIVVYSSASNRYPEDPQVLMAYVQMANAYDQLHKTAEARSMLQQARVILKQMPDSSFRPVSTRTNMSREQWQRWLQWASRLHNSSRTSAVAPALPRPGELQ